MTWHNFILELSLLPLTFWIALVIGLFGLYVLFDIARHCR